MISYSNPSHRKDSDGQSISPYACYIVIFHPKVRFYKAGQGVKVSRQEYYINTDVEIIASLLIRLYNDEDHDDNHDDDDDDDDGDDDDDDDDDENDDDESWKSGKS